MKIQATLQVSAKQLYTYLLTQIYEDVQKSDKRKDVKIQDLDGYEYIKKLRHGKQIVPLKIHIGPLIENVYYEVSYSTPSAYNRYFYDLHALSNQSVGVTYIEENQANGNLNNWVYKMRVLMQEKKLEKRVILSLQDMEKQILQNENAKEDIKP